MNKYNPHKHHRRSIRLRGYDYSQAGLYFITICCKNRAHLFGEVQNGEMVLNIFGKIAFEEWLATEMVREAEHAESKADFVHKMAIAQKEINETIYWLELLAETDYLVKQEFESLNNDAVELIKILTAIIKKTKQNLITNI